MNEESGQHPDLAPPQHSSDGRWSWDGRQWTPVQEAALRPGPGEAEPPTDEQKLWGLLSHLSLFVLAIIGPVIVMQTLGKRSQYVRYHAAEALNFHITVATAAIAIPLLSGAIQFLHASSDDVEFFVTMIEYVLLMAVLAAAIVFSIIAAVRSYRGQLYQYPLTLRFVSRGQRPTEAKDVGVGRPLKASNVEVDVEGYAGWMGKLEDDLLGPVENLPRQTMDQQPAPQQGAPAPQYSPDRRWWWNGREWQPVSQQSEPPSGPSQRMPPRWLYLVAVVAVVLAAALVSLVLRGFFSGFPANATRVNAPGTTEITLGEPGTYTISYEQPADGNGWSIAENGEPLHIPPQISSVQLELVSTASGAPVPIHPLPGNVTYQVGSSEGKAIAQFSVDRPGKYSLVSGYPNGQSEPQIVLAVARGSPDVLISVLGAFAGGILLLAGLGLGILTLILRILAKHRTRIAAQSVVSRRHP